MGTGASRRLGDSRAEPEDSQRQVVEELAEESSGTQCITALRTPCSEGALKDFGRSAPHPGTPTSREDVRRWTMPPHRFDPDAMFFKGDMESIKESLRHASRQDPALGKRLVSPKRAAERPRRFSTGNAQRSTGVKIQGGHVHHDNVYSTGLMEAVKGRMRLAKGEARSDNVLTSAELDDPHRILAAAELFNMITRQFSLPALTDAARDFAMQRLARHEEVNVGHVVIQQGSPDISKLYIMTSGAVAFFVDGDHKRTLKAPLLFGELSVIYGTERTAEARVVDGPKDSGAPVLWTLDKTAWEEFMAMDIRHRAMAEAGAGRVETYTKSPQEIKLECTIQLLDLEPICRLGEGGFSTVTLAHDQKTDSFYAVKTMDKSSILKNALAKKVITEKSLLERVAKSNFCLRLHQTYMTGDFIYILTEVAECGDLMEHMINLNIIPYMSARYYSACICLGIAHCHQAKFVHRDIKPENCLVFADGRVKLGDFGLSKELPYSVDLGDGNQSVCTLAFTMCGTPEFLAPEFIFSRGHDPV
mmetsp:Transcript_4619/g.13982  ORF Transcript_4619/g.13982 Transcript_4619/m.13982 type:complete len:532 (-) Transcript_4619:733-2328(-)